jgi:hypothetical protein
VDRANKEQELDRVKGEVAQIGNVMENKLPTNKFIGI